MNRTIIQGKTAQNSILATSPTLSGLRLLGMFGLGVLLTLLAYQLPVRHAVDVGGYDAAYVQNFYAAERQQWRTQPYLAGSDGSARWSHGESYLLFPQIGLPAELRLRLRGYPAPDGSARELVVLNNQTELARVAVDAGWQELTVAVRGELLKPSDLLIVLRTSTTRLADGRETGVLIDRAELRTTAWPIVPYPAQLALGGIVAVLLFLLACLVPRQEPGARSQEPGDDTAWIGFWSSGRLALGVGLGLLLGFVLLYRMQPPFYPYPLRWLLVLANLLLLALLALRLVALPSMRQLARPLLGDVAAAAAILGWTLALLVLAQGHVTLSVPGVEKDFRVYATRTVGLEEIFRADGFYNLGYPLLLWLVQPATAANPFLAARLVGLLAGALLLGASYLLVRTLLGVGYALIGLLVLALSGLVVQYGLYLGSDMPFAAFTTLALALLFMAFRAEHAGLALPGDVPTASTGLGSRVSGLGSPVACLLSGLAAGSAFLMRHPGLLLLPYGLLAVWVAWRWGGLAHARRFALLFGLGFALAAAPQLIVNSWQTGSPLYSQQAKNVWLAVYGNTDWNRWEEVPNTITLGTVVLHDPARFLANWTGNLRAFTGTGAEDNSEFGRAVQLRLLGWPANWLALAGLLGMLLLGGWRERLLLIWIGLYVGAVSVTFLLPRFVLPLAPIYALAVAWALRELLRRAPEWRRLQLGFLAALLLALLLGPGWRAGTRSVLANQPPAEVAAVVLVEGALGPADRLLVGLPGSADEAVFAEVPLGKYSAIAHRVTRDSVEATYLLSTLDLSVIEGRSLSRLGVAGPYRLYRIVP